jgi:ABC-type bacteriocin/lantibiotic exporter with double-glycine peptidase domain
VQTYSIPDVPLVTQSKNMACWYASAQMLVQWRRSRLRQSERNHPDPSEVPALQAEFLSNDGLPTKKILELAKSLGLRDVAPSTPSPGAIASLLKQCGPLWFAGLHPSGHVVVITGITADDIEVNDPWPTHGKCRYTFSRFGQILRPLSFDASKLSANILYFAD